MACDEPWAIRMTRERLRDGGPERWEGNHGTWQPATCIQDQGELRGGDVRVG